MQAAIQLARREAPSLLFFVALVALTLVF